MDVGKGVPNHYKSEFEFSTFISFLYLFCAYIIVWKKDFEKPNSPPPPLWVFFLIKHSLCFLSLVELFLVQAVIGQNGMVVSGDLLGACLPNISMHVLFENAI